MRDILRQQWCSLKKGRPGHRFQQRYEVAKKARHAKSGMHQVFRVFRMVLAVGAMAVGFVLMFIPGPAVIFYFIAGSLLASESKVVARLLDWAEVKARAVGKRAQNHWNKLPQWGRSVLVGCGACISAASAYVSYRLMTR
jgi:hypothetical protein